MQRWIPWLAAALALQLALAVGLGLRGDRLGPAAAGALLIDAKLDGIDQLVIDGPAVNDAAGAKPARVELLKRDSRWRLPGYHDAPADAARVTSLLERIGKLHRGLPVATTDAAAQRFKVADDEYERRLVMSAGKQALATLYLGNSPGVRKSYARTSADTSVHAVELAAVDLNTAASDWFDQGLLARDEKSIARIDAAGAGGTGFTLRRGAKDANPAWQAQGLPGDKAVDAAKADALARAIANFRVHAILATAAQAEWQQDAPVLRLTLEDAQGKSVSWVLSKPKSGDFHVLKTSDQAWFFEVKDWSARSLLDAAAQDKLALAPGAAPAATGSGAAAAGAAGTAGAAGVASAPTTAKR
jgi:Domain of unknown function (DUF4340)